MASADCKLRSQSSQRECVVPCKPGATSSIEVADTGGCPSFQKECKVLRCVCVSVGVATCCDSTGDALGCCLCALYSLLIVFAAFMSASLPLMHSCFSNYRESALPLDAYDFDVSFSCDYSDVLPNRHMWAMTMPACCSRALQASNGNKRMVTDCFA